MRNSSANDLAQMEQTFSTDPSHIAIVMLGAQDRYSVSRRRGAEERPTIGAASTARASTG